MTCGLACRAFLPDKCSSRRQPVELAQLAVEHARRDQAAHDADAPSQADGVAQFRLGVSRRGDDRLGDEGWVIAALDLIRHVLLEDLELLGVDLQRHVGPHAVVAMYRVTANVLRVKSAWRFTLTHITSLSEAAAALWADIDANTVELLARAQREGPLAQATDLAWMRQVYYALLTEALNRPGTEQDSAAHDPDVLAALVIDTLLHGGGPRD
jgi:hypothetical protein